MLNVTSNYSVKSQTEEAMICVIQGCLSGGKFGAWVHSRSEPRHEVDCAEKWALPCQQDPPPSSLEVKARRQGLLAKPQEAPTSGDLNPNSTEGSLPTCVTRAVRVAWTWPENPVPRFPRPRLASDSAALQRNCAPDNCTGVSNASESLPRPLKAWSDVTKGWTANYQAPNFHQEAAEALGKPTSSLHVGGNNAGKLPRVRVFVGFWFFKNQNWSALYPIDSENSHQKFFCNLFK